MKIQDRLTDIERLFSEKRPLESFGPNSDYPYLAFDLEAAKTVDPRWLSRLPCPVIGIGNGPLEKTCDVALKNGKKLAMVTKNVLATPIAAMVLVQHLRASERLSLSDALTAESFAYAALQTGPEFKAWLQSYEGPKTLTPPDECLIVEREDQILSIRFNDPDNRNAIGVAMRDALCDALDLALLDPDIKRIDLGATGQAFSTGGAVEEFGDVSDPATAHWIRSLRLPALRLARLHEKLNVTVNGAAIGAGAEIAGFGRSVTATSKAWFQLPELKYGLIPGAGGTASLARRIGRQRTAYLALSMERISSKTAFEWGLVDTLI